MKADAMSLTFLSNEGLVKIPFFQRGYVWTSGNWDDLLTDLLDFRKSQFLGSLILKQVEQQTGKPKEVLVIDGQQRLTTLSVLLRCLYNSFDADTQENCDVPIRNHLFYKKSQTDKDYFVKIEHSKVDRKYFQQVIRNEVKEDEYKSIILEDEVTKTSSKSNRVLQCYKYYSERLKTVSVEDRLTLFNRLLDQHNKMIVVIDLTEKENEQAIFDTINSAGVRLSSADIVKNALFQRALELYDREEEVITLYDTYWEAIFLKDDDAILYWEGTRLTGRLIRDNVEILLHSISVIKGFFNPDEHTLSDMSDLFKNYIESCDKQRLTDFIKEIAKYATLFRSKVLVFDRSSMLAYADSYSRLFHVLAIAEISTFHPYILSLFYKYDSNEVKLKEELLKIEKFVVRRMITRAETKSYNKKCKEFIDDNSTIDTRIAEQTDEAFINGLNSITNKHATLLLFWVELFRRNNDSKQSMKELKYNYSLEHIMPQKWEEYWSNIPILDQSGNVISDVELAKQERTRKIYSIGNMTLLNSSLNTSLRNYEFNRKIEGEGRKKGMRHYADLTITRFDVIDTYDAGETVWNEFRISNRTAELGKDLLAIW